MSIQSAKIFEDVIMYLSILRYIFKSRTKKGLYDLNKKAEPFFMNLLNIVYGWNLQNLNMIQSNYPAIDLGDKNKSVCIQVTAANKSAKIRKTIESFLNKKLYDDYKRLLLFIITDKKQYTAQFKTEGKFTFSINDVDDLLTDIETLQLAQLNKLHAYLKAELSTIIAVTAEPSSLLAKAEKKINLPPLNGEKLFAHLQYRKEEKEKGLSELKKFYDRLSALPKQTREYLHLIVMNGSVTSDFSNSQITIQPLKLESLLNISRTYSKEQLQILEESRIGSYCDDREPPVIEVSFKMDTGVELLAALKEFSGSETALTQIIVGCDFAMLDAG